MNITSYADKDSENGVNPLILRDIERPSIDLPYNLTKHTKSPLQLFQKT